jgi:hypothetical protein
LRFAEESTTIADSFAAPAAPDVSVEEVSNAETAEAKVNIAPGTASGTAFILADVGADTRLEAANGPSEVFDRFDNCFEERELSGLGRLSCLSIAT